MANQLDAHVIDYVQFLRVRRMVRYPDTFKPQYGSDVENLNRWRAFTA